MGCRRPKNSEEVAPFRRRDRPSHKGGDIFDRDVEGFDDSDFHGDLLRLGVDADFFSMLAYVLERDDAIHEGEERIVFAFSHVVARMDSGAALAYNNRTGANLLTAKGFDAQTLALAVATVARTADTFFMGHFFPPPPASPGDRRQENVMLYSVSCLLYSLR